jgi:cobalt/nickel transport system permease protein
MPVLGRGSSDLRIKSSGPYVLLVLLLVAAAASVPAGHWLRLALLAAILWLATLPLARATPRLGSQVAAGGFFLALLALGVLWRRPVSPTDALLVPMGHTSVTLSRAALLLALFLVAKAGAALVGVVAASTALGERGWLAGLQSLRLPGFLVASLMLTVRYLQVSAVALETTRRAMALRGVPADLRSRARSAGHSVGALVVRGVEQGERVGWAMVCRGFTGRLPSLAPSRSPVWQWLLATSAGAACLVLSLHPW